MATVEYVMPFKMGLSQMTQITLTVDTKFLHLV